MNKILNSESFEKAITDIVTDLSQNMYEVENYTDEEIDELFDLSEAEAVELTKVLNDNLIAVNKVYSNLKTEERLTEVQAEMSTYVNKQIANSGTLKRKIITSTDDVIDEQYLYLILEDADNNIYNQYMLIDDAVTQLGSTTVNLTDYVLVDDLIEILEDYAKVNEALSADKVVNDLTNVSNDTVLSTQGISDTLTDYAKTTDLDNYVETSNVVTTLGSSSTDTQIPSAKVVYDRLSNFSLSTYVIADLANNIINTTITTLSDLHSSIPTNSMILMDAALDTTNFFGLPHKYFCILWTRRYTNRDIIIAVQTNTNNFYICTNVANQTWEKVCTTSVADVPLTTIEYNDSYIDSSTGNPNVYTVQNGICYVNVDFFAKTSGNANICTLPRPKYLVNISTMPLTTTGGQVASLSISETTGEVGIWGATVDKRYLTSFSYPVAE